MYVNFLTVISSYYIGVGLNGGVRAAKTKVLVLTPKFMTSVTPGVIVGCCDVASLP